MRSAAADVVVVGGGPAGAATAARLAARGRDVLVLDKRRFPREKACAEYFSPGAVDALERLGALDAVHAHASTRPPGIRLVSARESFLVSYDRPALGVARPLLDAALLAGARAAGARVLEGAQVLGALVEDGRAAGVRARVDGEEVLARARLVVGADGLRSAVARSLALERPARWPRRLGLVARFGGVSALGDVAEMHVGPDSYCGLAPVGDGFVTVALVVPLGGKRPGEPTASYFQRRLAELPGVRARLRGGARVTPISGAAPLGCRPRRAAGPGFLLVGDAAGFLDPFTGEGVYRALRGAELAADAASRALSRPDGVPAGYEEARRAEFADKERVCLLVQAFLSSRGAFDYALRRLRRRPDVARLLCGVLGDYLPARRALAPSYLLALLRP